MHSFQSAIRLKTKSCKEGNRSKNEEIITEFLCWTNNRNLRNIVIKTNETLPSEDRFGLVYDYF